MTTMRQTLCLFALLAVAAPARAAQFDFTGDVDFRLVLPPSDDRSWLEGGLGKLRYGEGDSNFQFAGAIGQAQAIITPELLAVAVARLELQQRSSLDLLEAYARYRPVSTTQWRWSVKGGAFFAPMSLENTELGWAPYWTITPSAINSWFGDELRTVGTEFMLEWRRDEGTLSLIGSGFGDNEPAGVLIADRGWAMDDVPTGLFDQPREPDATLKLFGATPPGTTPMFAQYDDQIGWYAGASWNDASQWRAEVFRYDNEADPSAHQDGHYGWHTAFWDGGFSDQLGEFTMLSQALTGNTIIAPAPGFSSVTDYASAYALLGWERDDWRLAGRADTFRTQTHDTFGSSPAFSENGYALTAAATWLPNDWFRLTGEILALSSKRGERAVVGIDPQQEETQFQLSARFYLN
jgi:hypothetical protein